MTGKDGILSGLASKLLATKTVPAAPSAPTARVLELLAPLQRTVIRHRGEVLTVAPPELDALREQLLGLLGVPLSTYQAVPTPLRNSR